MRPLPTTVQDLANITITTTTEKALLVLVLAGVREGQKIFLEGWTVVTSGTDTAQLAMRIRQGSTISGTLEGEDGSQDVTAADVDQVEIKVEAVAYQDDPEYVLTIIQGSATGNGTASRQTFKGERVN